MILNLADKLYYSWKFIPSVRLFVRCGRIKFIFGFGIIMDGDIWCNLTMRLFDKIGFPI